MKRLPQGDCIWFLASFSAAVFTGVCYLQNHRESFKGGSGEAGSHAKAAAMVFRWAKEGACRGTHMDQDPDCPTGNQHSSKEL